MSDASPSDYVDTGMEKPPRLPPPEYRPHGGEALERLFAAHAKRMDAYAAYSSHRSRVISAQHAQTQERIAQRRQARTRGR